MSLSISFSAFQLLSLLSSHSASNSLFLYVCLNGFLSYCLSLLQPLCISLPVSQCLLNICLYFSISVSICLSPSIHLSPSLCLITIYSNLMCLSQAFYVHLRVCLSTCLSFFFISLLLPDSTCIYRFHKISMYSQLSLYLSHFFCLSLFSPLFALFCSPTKPYLTEQRTPHHYDKNAICRVILF